MPPSDISRSCAQVAKPGVPTCAGLTKKSAAAAGRGEHGKADVVVADVAVVEGEDDAALAAEPVARASTMPPPRRVHSASCVFEALARRPCSADRRRGRDVAPSAWYMSAIVVRENCAPFMVFSPT